MSNLQNHKHDYFHISTLGVTYGIFRVEIGKFPAQDYDGVCCGPFKSFSSAKRDAINFHKSDLEEVKGALAGVRDLRVADVVKAQGVKK